MLWHILATLLGLLGTAISLLLLIEYFRSEEKEDWYDINSLLTIITASVSILALLSGLTGSTWSYTFTISLSCLYLFTFIIMNIDVYREHRFLIKGKPTHSATKKKLDIKQARRQIERLEQELANEKIKKTPPPPIAKIIGNPRIPQQWQEPFARLVVGRVREATQSCLETLSHRWNLTLYQPIGPGTLKDFTTPADTSTKRCLDLIGIPELLNLPCSFTLPEKIRTEHHHIVAGTGAGKSQCIESLVLKDVELGNRVIVIDSQNDLIDRLATRLPHPLLIDPLYCPPPLNLFALDASADLFEYIFQALDAEMTSKQSTAYRYVSQLVVKAKGNITLMRRLLEPGDLWHKYEGLMSETTRSFFSTEYASKQFTDTRQQILRRLYQVLENERFEQMLSASSCVNIIQDRPVLISTRKGELRQEGASLLGRIFIAQVMNAVIGKRQKRTFLYLDEFQDYAEDSPVLFNLFEQARKYGLGLIIAHQYLGQLPPQLQQSVSANTAIKFAKNVSAEDARKLASQMHTTADFIQSTPPGVFTAYLRNYGVVGYPVRFGYLDTLPELATISAVRERMRNEYTPLPRSNDPQKEPYRGPQNEQGSGGEVPESGEW